MIEPRFTVLTTTGYRISRHALRRGACSGREGATATVYDRHFQVVIVSYASEDRLRGFERTTTRGIDGAILAAKEKARELNLWHAAQG